MSYFLAAVVVIFVLSFISKGIIVVKQAEVYIIERLGKYLKTLDSGVHIIIPILDKPRVIKWRFIKTDRQGNNYIIQKSVKNLDLRETVYDFPKQNVITSDNVGIEINALLYFQVTDPMKACYEINDLPNAIEKLTQTTLRNVIGELDLDKTLTSRDTINTKLRVILDEATDKWGVKVNRVELQDINPPREIRAAMEKQMRAERDRRAKILEAEGEKKSKILVAEGDRNAKIAVAEGEAKSRLLVAEAEANAIQKVAKSVESTSTDPAKYLITLRYIKAFNDIVQKGDKTVVLPYESSSILGCLKPIKEMLS